MTTPLREHGRGPGPDGFDGFSLIELIVVIAIMAVLAGVAFPTVDILQTRARSDRTVEQLQALETALEEYFLDHLRYPDQLADLETDGYIVSSFTAGDAFLDGWGNGLVYRKTGFRVNLTSRGPDQTDSPDDIDLTIDGQRILRAETRENMKTIHRALGLYQAEYASLGLPPLPALWYHADPALCAMGILVVNGYLTNDSRYRSDAWNDDYGYLGSPSVHVTSINM
ncbi:MAG: type II secretion system protein GspG [Candidatus Eisenbacteria bacterium]